LTYYAVSTNGRSAADFELHCRYLLGLDVRFYVIENRDADQLAPREELTVASLVPGYE